MSNVILRKASKTKIIKPHLELPQNLDAYKKILREKIGIGGNILVRNKFEGKRALWNGKFFIDKNMTPLHVDSEFLKKMPTDAHLDGILINYSMDYLRPTKWVDLRYLVIDIFIANLNFKSRIELLKKLKLYKIIEIPKWTFISSSESRWELVNQLYKKSENGLIINIANDVDYKDIYEYSNGRTGSAIIMDFVEGIKQYRGILGKFKCLTLGGNFFYLSNSIPLSIRESYKFSRGQCTHKEADSPQKGDTIYFETNSFVRGKDIPIDPHYLLSID